MLIIFNASGGLVGVLGMVAGFMTAAVSGRLWPGVLILALVWIVVSVLWRRSGPKSAVAANPYQGGVIMPPLGSAAAPPSGVPAAPIAPIRKRRWPSVFFIPLFIWAIPLLLLTPMIAVAEHGSAQRKATDLRSSMWDAAQDNLRRGVASGEPQTAQRILRAIGGANFAGVSAEDTRVYADLRDDRVLVLVKIKNLKRFSDAGKGAVLDEVVRELSEHPTTKGKRPFVQVRGAFTPGAMQIDLTRRIGGAVPDGDFLAFYGDLPVPVSAPAATPSSPDPAKPKQP